MRKFLFACLLCIFHAGLSGQTIAPTQTDQIIIDNGTPGKADPGDRIRYKVTIQNTGGAPANSVQLNVTPDVLTTFVPGSFLSTPVAVNDGPYACTGNVPISVPTGSGVLVNDFDDNLAGATLTVITPPTKGSVVLNNDGSFTYTPNAGVTGMSDHFTYQINDGSIPPGCTPLSGDIQATVSINISNLIWFVDNVGGGSGGDGRRNTPFKSLSDFNAGSATAGDVIYIEHNMGMDYTGGIVLQNNERLFGEGHTGAGNLAGVLPFTLAMHSVLLPNINGSRPVITNASGDGVTLAMNNNLRGFDVGACSDFGMENTGTSSVGNLVVSEVSINNTSGGGFDASHGSGASTNAVFSSISSTGGTNGINLTNCAGTFTVNGGTISNPTGTGVLISGGSVTFSSSGAITDNTGFAVDVDNHDSNNVTFSGNITSTGTGIRVQNCGGGTKLFSGSSKSLTTTTNTAVTLNSNTGATINFTGGGLAISTSSGTGFSATGGGTVTVQGTGNTINSTSATALNVANMTIGTSNLNFQSISAGNNTAAADPANGIVLNNTGTSGGLMVTGTGTTSGSGGTIQNTTSHGIIFTSTRNNSLSNMIIGDGTAVPSQTPDAVTNINGNGIEMSSVDNTTLTNVKIARTETHGINGTEVTGLTISNSFILNAGDDNEESGLYFAKAVSLAENNLDGTVTITNTVIDAYAEGGITVENFAGSLNMTLSGVTIGRSANTFAGGGTFSEEGVQCRADGTSNITLTVNGNSLFDAVDGTAIYFFSEGTATTASVLNVSNTTIQNSTSIGIVVFGGTGNETSTIESKLNFTIGPTVTINGTGATAVSIHPNGKSTVKGTVSGITVNGTGSGRGIEVLSDDVSTAVVSITNNNVSNTAFSPIFASNQYEAKLDVHITNNTTAGPTDTSPPSGIAIHGIEVNVRENSVNCLDIKNNSSGGINGGAAFRTRQRDNSVFNLERFTGNGTSTADVITFLQNQNNPPIPNQSASATVNTTYTAVADGFCEDPS